jgi:uncharacterized protein YegP (UPF0339 family)
MLQARVNSKDRNVVELVNMGTGDILLTSQWSGDNRVQAAANQADAINEAIRAEHPQAMNPDETYLHLTDNLMASLGWCEDEHGVIQVPTIDGATGEVTVSPLDEYLVDVEDAIPEETKWYIKIWVGKDEQYYFALIAGNHRTIVVSEGYKAKTSAYDSIHAMYKAMSCVPFIKDETDVEIENETAELPVESDEDDETGEE